MLARILFYLVIYPISLLPYPLLYLFSDFLAFVLANIFKYRDKVISDNLKNSFPNKPQKELDDIKRKFYTHFSDLIFESLKGFNFSEKEARKRIVFEGLDDVEKFYKQGRDVLLLTGHYGNWETCGSALPLFISHLTLAVYKPLSNKFFDNKIKQTRTVFGVVLSSMKETKEKIKLDFGRPKATCFATDQSPSNPERAYWTTFLNQETAVLFGAEKYAKELNLPVIYFSILRQKRGYFKVVCQTLFEESKNTSYGEITEKHTQVLEQDIVKKPENWLWSHRRWKHKKPKNVHKI